MARFLFYRDSEVFEDTVLVYLAEYDAIKRFTMEREAQRNLTFAVDVKGGWSSTRGGSGCTGEAHFSKGAVLPNAAAGLLPFCINVFLSMMESSVMNAGCIQAGTCPCPYTYEGVRHASMPLNVGCHLGC